MPSLPPHLSIWILLPSTNLSNLLRTKRLTPHPHMQSKSFVKKVNKENLVVLSTNPQR